MQTKPEIFAIDYGTSNSLIAAANQQELSQPLAIDPAADDPSVLRSVLFYPDNKSVHFGQKAIEEYAENGCEGRLFRSIITPPQANSPVTLFVGRLICG